MLNLRSSLKHWASPIALRANVTKGNRAVTKLGVIPSRDCADNNLPGALSRRRIDDHGELG
jgi:hypothetical protein